MKHTSAPTRHSVIIGTGVAAVITAAFTLQSAHATPPPAPDPSSATAAAQRAKAIGTTLGADHAGSYYDATRHKLVVNVTNEKAAGKARAAGAEAKVVKHSLATLEQAQATLKQKAAVPGTSWAMDPRTNKVVIVVDRTVKSADLAKLTKVASSLGDRTAIKKSTGTIKPLIAGGDAIWGGGARCSLGFNVTKGGEPYFLTAGHCTNESRTWAATQGGGEIASTESSRFPGDDYGLVKFTANTSHPSEVNLYNGGTQPIARAGEAIVGQMVQRSGSTTQVHAGNVTALNATVNYQQGTVDGLIQTSVCAEPGDSGGPLFEGDTALGLTSGGSGNCSSGGETFYQPVPEVLEKTGAQIG
ncbi:S1 family peptidase [Streptomyces sp. Pv4-95]|uniref:S1 family peptidase n=1 Tax=Streptomyces sp. Pv4-95 TaxID=3049543 RepID=UPI0038928F65